MLLSCRIIEHCIKKRLQWNTSFARKVCRESEYYEDMMRYLRRNLAVCVVAKVQLFIELVSLLLLLKFYCSIYLYLNVLQGTTTETFVLRDGCEVLILIVHVLYFYQLGALPREDCRKTSFYMLF